jgi:integrase
MSTFVVTSTFVQVLAFLDSIRKNISTGCFIAYVDVLLCRHIAWERKVLWQNEGTARDQFITGTRIKSGWEVSRVHGHKWEALFTLAMATGMRRGKLLGLKWQDINVEAGLLQVRRVLSRVPTNMPGREHVYVEAEPKTQKSRRSVMIAPFALEALKKHRVSQLEAKLKAGEFWQEYDYVFCTLTGKHLNPNHVVEEFKKILTRDGLPDIRFHDLRHSAATLLLSLGIHPKDVQELWATRRSV